MQIQNDYLRIYGEKLSFSKHLKRKLNILFSIHHKHTYALALYVAINNNINMLGKTMSFVLSLKFIVII